MDVFREMVGDDLADAVEAAQTRLDDDTITLRIEEFDNRPGLVVVARGGVDLQHGLSHSGAIEYLEALA